jgi:2-oxoglutarate dehydrogenase E2 component (dihydrolipoamide succinyltransferase)
MIAENMVRSVSTAAQATAQTDVDMSAVTRIRAEVNGERAARGRPKLSVLAFIARATAATLMDHPDLNATFTDTHLVRWRTVNLGIAVDALHGLLVPVVRSAERLTAPALAEEIADLAERTRSRRLRTEDLKAPTFTISNSGSIGGVTSTPLLNHPNVGTLGVPALIRQPVAVTAPNGEEYVAIRPVMRLGLTFDHRAMDGADALRFLLDLQHRLETWPRAAYL